MGKTTRITNEEFIKRAKQIHGDKYDYSKVEYVNSHKKICIICHAHGEFCQTPCNHLNGSGCPKCAKKAIGIGNNSEFIRRAREIHGNTYDYSKVEYNGSNEKVCIICPKHGTFFQKASYHLSGNGCPKCGRINLWDKRGRKTKNEFIEDARLVHGDKYDYSECEYVNKRTKVKIICHKKYKNGIEHGEFYQTPGSHLNGNGCPHCRNSHLENFIHKKLVENKICFEKEKTFDWLINEGHMYIDFYLPDYNVAIECQGVQHFMPLYKKIKNYDACKMFEKIKFNDAIKREKCNEQHINVFYFTEKCLYENFKTDNMFYEFNELKNKINECKT